MYGGFNLCLSIASINFNFFKKKQWLIFVQEETVTSPPSLTLKEQNSPFKINKI